MSRSLSTLLVLCTAGGIFVYHHDENARPERSLLYNRIAAYEQSLDTLQTLEEKAAELEAGVSELRELLRGGENLTAEMKTEIEDMISRSDRMSARTFSPLEEAEETRIKYRNGIDRYNSAPYPWVWKPEKLPETYEGKY